jgi:hypothetical protein
MGERWCVGYVLAVNLRFPVHIQLDIPEVMPKRRQRTQGRGGYWSPCCPWAGRAADMGSKEHKLGRGSGETQGGSSMEWNGTGSVSDAM